MTSPALGGGKAYHMIFWLLYKVGIRKARWNKLWRGTDEQLRTFHAATFRNPYEQFDSCNTSNDVKITSQALQGCSAF